MPDVGTDLIAIVSRIVCSYSYDASHEHSSLMKSSATFSVRKTWSRNSQKLGLRSDYKLLPVAYLKAPYKNITYLSNLTKFRVVPFHLILHIFKVCLDDFSGVNVENIALLLEGCGRFLLRTEETSQRFGTMVRSLFEIVTIVDPSINQLELMRRKQSLQHFDQRQLLLLENAYYQVPLHLRYVLKLPEPGLSATRPNAHRGRRNIVAIWNFSFVTWFMTFFRRKLLTKFSSSSESLTGTTMKFAWHCIKSLRNLGNSLMAMSALWPCWRTIYSAIDRRSPSPSWIRSSRTSEEVSSKTSIALIKGD